eukprot:2403548-Prymnesium_polylepis.1
MGLERIRNFGTALRAGAAIGTGERHLRAQLVIRLAWRRYQASQSHRDELWKLIRPIRGAKAGASPAALMPRSTLEAGLPAAAADATVATRLASLEKKLDKLLEL